MEDALNIIKNILSPEKLAEHKCPTCEGYIPNNENIGAYMGALSRHGHGEVCSACGQREAMEDFFNSHIKVINIG
jgi:hypothetical protein